MNHQKKYFIDFIYFILLFILFYFISILLFNVKEKYTHQIGYVSLNVSFNLSIINLSKTRNNVYLRSYAVIKFGLLLKIERHKCKHIRENKHYV